MSFDCWLKVNADGRPAQAVLQELLTLLGDATVTGIEVVRVAYTGTSLHEAGISDREGEERRHATDSGSL